MQKKQKKYLPLSQEEWKQIEEYQKIPFKQKLAMLDRMRSFMFKLWQENPETYKAAQKFRRGEI